MNAFLYYSKAFHFPGFLDMYVYVGVKVLVILEYACPVAGWSFCKALIMYFAQISVNRFANGYDIYYFIDECWGRLGFISLNWNCFCIDQADLQEH